MHAGSFRGIEMKRHVRHALIEFHRIDLLPKHQAHALLRSPQRKNFHTHRSQDQVGMTRHAHGQAQQKNGSHERQKHPSRMRHIGVDVAIK